MINNINPKISVIVPVYNSEKYLNKCLDSLIYQTYQNLEIICIDDGSTDGSLDILNDYMKKDSRFVVLTQQNSGTSIARNSGLSVATGDYISFIDSDDWVLLTLYQSFVNTLRKLDSLIDIYVFNASSYIEGKNDIEPLLFYSLTDWSNHVSPLTIHTFDDCLRPFSRNLSAANKIYRKDFLHENQLSFEPDLKYEDQVFAIKSFLNAKSIILTDEVFYKYRNNTGLTCSNVITPKVFDIFKVVDLIENEINRFGVYDSYKYALFQYKYNVWVSHYCFCPENLKDKYYDCMKSRLIEVINRKTLDAVIYTKLSNYRLFEIISKNPRVVFEHLVFGNK